MAKKENDKQTKYCTQNQTFVSDFIHQMTQKLPVDRGYKSVSR